MKHIQQFILVGGLLVLTACSSLYVKPSAPSEQVHPAKPLAHPVGKNWQVIEEPPKLSDERGRLPFQSEQSVQPDGSRPAAAGQNRKIETSH